MRMTRLYLSPNQIKRHTPGSFSAVLTKEQAYYLIKVMRLRENDQIQVFEESLGEYIAMLSFQSSSPMLVLQEQIKKPLQQQDFCQELHLAFSPLRSHLTHFVIEKATELGVTHIHPLLMERTQNRQISIEKVKKISIEAAEQSERLTLPIIFPLSTFDSFLAQIAQVENSSIDWLAALERKEAPLIHLRPAKQKMGVLIGPEGGLCEKEQKKLLQHMTAVSLGPLILRAETAALCSLSYLSLAQGSLRI